jgi:glycosyltransferase involved in cell wall biosynthesis
MHSTDESLPMVSVIVPVKNGSAKIRDLLGSLERLDYPQDKLEVLIVDGNSTDGTREVVSEYHVKLLTEERPGINAARNTGLKHSTGEIVAFTDADCVVSEDWVRKIVEDFQDQTVACVAGNVEGYYHDFLSKYSDESILPVLRRFSKREVLDRIKPPLQYPAGCNMAVRRAVIEKVGLFDESIAFGFDEDELVERICKDGNRMVLDPAVLVRHKHRSSLAELLKQNFRYGRGMGLLPRVRGFSSTFSKWILLLVCVSVAWAGVILFSAVMTVLTSSVAFLATLLTSLLFPLVGLIVYYAYRSIKLGDKGLLKIVTYPFIDFGRSLVFLVGGVYQLLKPGKKPTP